MNKLPKSKIRNLAAEKALREAKADFGEVHLSAKQTLDKFANESLFGLSNELRLHFIDQFAAVKLMVALSSPPVVKELQSQIAALGRQLTPIEKVEIVSRIAPEALKITLK